MATVIHGVDGRGVYADVLTKLRLFGHSRDSRNGPTRDLGHTTIVLDEPFRALPLGTGRGLSQKVAAAEAIQLIGGFSDPEWLVQRAPRMSEYRQPSGEFWGAYGARIGWQVRDVVTKLRADPDTRQAVVTLWDPYHDNEPDKLDYPCTVALGFELRRTYTGSRRQLNMNVLMRSNDAWLGLPYDVFQFTQLQHTVRRLLGANHGTYTHTAWSLHMYDADVEASHRVTAPSLDETFFDPTGIGELNTNVVDVVRRARTIALSPEKVDWQLTESERWYLDVLHS